MSTTPAPAATAADMTDSELCARLDNAEKAIKSLRAKVRRGTWTAADAEVAINEHSLGLPEMRAERTRRRAADRAARKAAEAEQAAKIAAMRAEPVGTATATTRLSAHPTARVVVLGSDGPERVWVEHINAVGHFVKAGTVMSIPVERLTDFQANPPRHPVGTRVVRTADGKHGTITAHAARNGIYVGAVMDDAEQCDAANEAFVVEAVEAVEAVVEAAPADAEAVVSQDLIDAVRTHAVAHYNDGGWDVVVECWDDDEIAEHLAEHDAKTLDEAVAAFEPVVDVWADRQAEAQYQRRAALGEDARTLISKPEHVWDEAHAARAARATDEHRDALGDEVVPGAPLKPQGFEGDAPAKPRGHGQPRRSAAPAAPRFTVTDDTRAELPHAVVDNLPNCAGTVVVRYLDRNDAYAAAARLNSGQPVEFPTREHAAAYLGRIGYRRPEVAEGVLALAPNGPTDLGLGLALIYDDRTRRYSLAANQDITVPDLDALARRYHPTIDL